MSDLDEAAAALKAAQRGVTLALVSCSSEAKREGEAG